MPLSLMKAPPSSLNGLASTPTIVIVTPTSDAGDFYVTNLGATTFQIAFDGTGTRQFYWYAEFKP